MILGFTGTRKGMSTAQRNACADMLKAASEAHHGDCKGADAEFHELALAADVPVVIHPPTDPKHRAWCKGAVRVEPEAPYLQRNRAIMRASDIAIGCPAENIEPAPARGQGTWSAIRFARKRNAGLVVVVLPDGRRTG